jgi:hypothetical protein
LKLKAKRQKLEACIGELLVFCWMSQTFQNENALFFSLDGKITYKFCMCYNEDTPKIRKGAKSHACAKPEFLDYALRAKSANFRFNKQRRSLWTH